MEKLKKLIYSVKYLPQILFFGSIGFLFYAFSIAGTGNDFIPFVNAIFLPFSLFFLYILHLNMKNYNTKKKFGGKGCWRR